MKRQARTYRDELVLALRLHDVGGDRIGEVLAEVETHTQATGEDPHEAFGPPKRYAAEVAEAVGSGGPGSWSGWIRGVWTDSTWGDRLSWPATALGAVALADGVARIGSGDPGWFGLPAGVIVLGGVLVLVAVAVWGFRGGRFSPDPVVDPRTGGDALPPLPLWRRLVLLGWPLAMVLGVGLFAYLTRS